MNSRSEENFIWNTYRFWESFWNTLRLEYLSAHLRCRAPRARAAGLRVGGRAQLVRLRGNQDDGARANGSRRRADKRVYCHEALHLKGKLQTAGYKQAVEKWDTDSDSDSSDEEDLKM